MQRSTTRATKGEHRRRNGTSQQLSVSSQCCKLAHGAASVLKDGRRRDLHAPSRLSDGAKGAGCRRASGAERAGFCRNRGQVGPRRLPETGMGGAHRLPERESGALGDVLLQANANTSRSFLTGGGGHSSRAG